ncbi:hypothetical protein AQUCO_04100083v1 [Aquilegia coerulea]|uniref:Bifunctional inhibitor/plant lipid transfer protein/seed storage helical domain-containing protein n=1 Tax=Aquilegia coerulea TaxID=218851 RepID=A0A2G5CQ54_AQUCA|nr:hypothetical protein AQUCO_04100083v1 [Aquilegia coerulea]
MKVVPYVISIFIVLVLLVSIVDVSIAFETTCDQVTYLHPCYLPITQLSRPSSKCCTRLRNHSGCLCRFQMYTLNARKLAEQCGVPFPKCPN